MTAKSPPIPKDNRSDKGPGDAARLDVAADQKIKPGVPDPAKQGEQGNTRINLTPHLSTQDR
jgi:hypothetical protein